MYNSLPVTLTDESFGFADYEMLKDMQKLAMVLSLTQDLNATNWKEDHETCFKMISLSMAFFLKYGPKGAVYVSEKASKSVVEWLEKIEDLTDLAVPLRIFIKLTERAGQSTKEAVEVFFSQDKTTIIEFVRQAGYDVDFLDDEWVVNHEK